MIPIHWSWTRYLLHATTKLHHVLTRVWVWSSQGLSVSWQPGREHSYRWLPLDCRQTKEHSWTAIQYSSYLPSAITVCVPMITCTRNKNSSNIQLAINVCVPCWRETWWQRRQSQWPQWSRLQPRQGSWPAPVHGRTEPTRLLSPLSFVSLPQPAREREREKESCVWQVYNTVGTWKSYIVVWYFLFGQFDNRQFFDCCFMPWDPLVSGQHTKCIAV